VGKAADSPPREPGTPAQRLRLPEAESHEKRQARGSRSASAWALRAARRPARGQIYEVPASPEAWVGRPSVAGVRGDMAAQRVRVKSQRKLTLPEAGTEIREVILEPSGGQIPYRAGDSLAVFPHNDPDLVRALLRAVGARGQEVVTTPSGSCEVWRCLLEDVDISHVSKETLRLFELEATDSREARALGDLSEQGAPAGFDLLDLLGMFPSSRPSIDQIVATLAVLEPRLYSIASAPGSQPGELPIAVRIVRTERGGRERRGVASHFLTSGVFIGDELTVHVHAQDRFVLPDDRSGPMIMLGFGTGVARHRAFLQELEARGRRGNTWLIVASCFDGDETLYEAELRAWSRLGVLEHLDVLKVGQRGGCVGPQDILRKRARRVAAWLERGAVIYACGEGKASALLSDTLIEVLGRQGRMSRTEASDFVHVMRRDGRYVEEVY
jgi:sulfite reductase (NADPH) flavoprotein alpha-component